MSTMLPDAVDATQSATVCDLDGQGKGEILFGNGDIMAWESRPNAVLRFDPGTGELVDDSEALGFLPHPDLTETMVCGDVNGDGRADVLVVNTGQRNWLYLSNPL